MANIIQNETEYLLSSAKNAEILLAAISAPKTSRIKFSDIEELKRQIEN